jgi:DNA-nicking Smr family endonuclease
MTRKLAPEERALWRHATSGVRPRRAGAPEAVVTPAPHAPPPAPAPAPAQAPGAGLDRRSAQRLKRGQVPIEARLDLHGLTQDEAHGALLRFIARAHDAGQRAVLVITGKGAREGEGVLRRAAPRWLQEPACRAFVLAVEEAQGRHGGAGALYVLLRRMR